MKRWTIALVCVLLLTGCGGSTEDGGKTSVEKSVIRSETTEETTAVAVAELRKLVIESSSGKDVRLRVEVADDAAEQAQGLMNRKKLGKQQGMLFVYPSERVMSFWMRNTLIPLSIAYIDSEDRIIDLQDMEPLDDEPPHYVSAEPAQYALEVNQGFFDERGVKVGDKVDLPK